MSAEELINHLSNLELAAEVVEAIDDCELQQRRGWDLSGWRYELIPWGVRFVCRGAVEAEVFVKAVLPRQAASGGVGVVVSEC